MSKQIGQFFAEVFAGKKVRFTSPGFGDDDIYTIERLAFGGYDTHEDDDDPGVDIQFFCQPLDPNQPNVIPVFCCGLADEVEIIENEGDENNA